MNNKPLNENILGLFPDQSSIQETVSKLRHLDISAANISVEIAHDKRTDPPIVILGRQKRTKAAESSITSAFIGAGLGATLGSLLNASFAMEVYMAVIVGMLIFSFLGAVAGYIVGHMVQENDESEAARELKADEVLLTVHVDDEEHAQLAQNILKSAGARIQVVPAVDLSETTIPTHL